MRRLCQLLSALILIASCLPVLAADSATVRSAVDEFMKKQVKGLPGTASYSIGTIDVERLAGACDGYDVAMGAGAKPWGRTQVSIRCRGGSWNIWVPVHIRVVADYLVMARTVNPGQKLADEDLRWQPGDLSEQPADVLLNKEQAIGREAVAMLAAGRPLRADMIRLPRLVQQGQNVKVIGTGSGFQVTNEGIAMSGGAVGQLVQVRLNSGKVVSGTLRADGAVEIRF